MIRNQTQARVTYTMKKSEVFKQSKVGQITNHSIRYSQVDSTLQGAYDWSVQQAQAESRQRRGQQAYQRIKK